MNLDKIKEIGLLIEHAEVETGDCYHGPTGPPPAECRRCQARHKLAAMILLEPNERGEIEVYAVQAMRRDNDNYEVWDDIDDTLYASKESAQAEADKHQEGAHDSEFRDYQRAKAEHERKAADHAALVAAGRRVGTYGTFHEFKGKRHFDITEKDIVP